MAKTYQIPRDATRLEARSSWRWRKSCWPFIIWIHGYRSGRWSWIGASLFNVSLELSREPLMKALHLSLAGLILAGYGLCVLPSWKAEGRAEPQVGKKARMLMVTTSKTFTNGPVKREKEELAPSEVAVTPVGQTSGLFTGDCTH